MNKETNKLIQYCKKLDDNLIWNYLIDNKEKFIVELDNDQTLIIIKESEDEDGNDIFFYAPCVGNTKGVAILLETLGFEVRNC